MAYLILTFIGFVGGAIAVYFSLESKRRRLDQLEQQTIAQAELNAQRITAIDSHNRTLVEKLEQQATAQADLNAQRVSAIDSRNQALIQEADRLMALRRELESRVISFDELKNENAILKRELRNSLTHSRKTQLDVEAQQNSQATTEQKVQELGERYFKDNVKWISNQLNASNFATCKQRLLDTIDRCREIGLTITNEQQSQALAELQRDYEKEVRVALEREEQARIKAQIREEQRVEREIERELGRAEAQRVAIEAALAEALSTAADQHSAEIEDLKVRLAEAEATQRAISQAQLTKAGFVYVISNIGSFGEGVFKVGMTRRLEPLDRVRELGDASVPFPFDVHMMISCENAPALERAIHRQLFRLQINKTNPKKEFFRTDIESIYKIVREHHGEVAYAADPEALQYRQSLTMTSDDQEFIEQVFDEFDQDGELDAPSNEDPRQRVLLPE